MRPNFTLSLSFDGIRLLYRVQDGWHLVGEVALDVPDLSRALAELRARGRALAPQGMFCKLLIPEDQIRFATIETARTSLQDVHAVLDGTTPYAIDELVIDFDRSGGRTHIAAVARETLSEAEAFAREHGFNPVAFVAVAEPYTFQGEVFFGPTSDAAAAGIERDDQPVRITGKIAPPVEPARVIPAEEAPPGASVTLPHFDAGDAAGGAAPDAEDEAPVETVFATRHRRGSTVMPPVAAPPEPVMAAAAEVDDDTLMEPHVEPLFTRRKEPPALAVAVGAASGPAVAAPVLDVPPAPARSVVAEVPDPGDTYRPVTGQPAAAASSAAPVSAVADPDAAPPKQRGKPRFLALKLTAALLLFLLVIAWWSSQWAENGLAGLFRTDPPATAPAEIAGAPVQTTALPAPDTAPAPQTLPDEAESPVAEAAAADPAPAAAPPLEQIAPEIAEVIESQALQLPILTGDAPQILSPDEADRIYAATGVYQRAPRFAVEPRIGTLDAFQPSRALPDSARAAVLTLPDAAAMAPDGVLLPLRNPPPPGTVFPRDARGFIQATPEGTLTPDGVMIYAGAPAIVPRYRPGTVLDVTTDAVTAGAPAPAPVQPEAVQPGVADDTAVAVLSGPPPVVPPLRPAEQLLQGATSPVVPVTPEQMATVQAAIIEGQPPQRPIEQEPQGETASAAPVTPEEIAADASTVIEGPPPVLPPLRPEGLAPETLTEVAPTATDAAEPVVNVVQGAPPRRPPLRPESFAALAAPADAPAETAEEAPAELAETATPEPTADPALAGFRARLRPAELAAAAAEATRAAEAAAAAEAEAAAAAQAAAEPDIEEVLRTIAEAAPESPFVNLTPRAIAISVRPDSRPRNFDRVVASVQQRQARAAAPAAAAATAPQATPAPAEEPTQVVRATPAKPSGPVPGGVARAATMDNAIARRQINLIGVFGRPGDRRALVRLGNGQLLRVEVGSTLDGGQVTAIGDSALNYVKRGRTYALQLPAG